MKYDRLFEGPILEDGTPTYFGFCNHAVNAFGMDAEARTFASGWRDDAGWERASSKFRGGDIVQVKGAKPLNLTVPAHLVDTLNLRKYVVK